ncbi:SRPBCC family protein [Streptomyces sp. NPDC049906]|uniref:SRPBCC family protein n=1 Tax=Streptomyces sp. NPDC049906 TaxID=3155656 RepID=UPI003414CC48
MTPQLTGRLLDTGEGIDLVLTRGFDAPVPDVWASLTEPERTALWFGPWEGRAAPGRTVRVRMAFEEGEPRSSVRIETCEPPRRLVVTTQDAFGSWRLEARLTETPGPHTEFTLVHHLAGTAGLGEIGPGWECYLDRLVHAREGGEPPRFGDYYPALKEPYERLRAVPG